MTGPKDIDNTHEPLKTQYTKFHPITKIGVYLNRFKIDFSTIFKEERKNVCITKNILTSYFRLL